MKVVVISHALVVDIYREKFVRLAKSHGVDILLLTPKKWREGGRTVLTGLIPDNFSKSISTLRFYGFHGATFFYGPEIFKYVKDFRPDIVHIEEEPYSFACMQLLLLKRFMHDAKWIVFTWQNILKNYLPPFNLIERYVLGKIDAVVAGNLEAAQIVTFKGFNREVSVIPQIGVNLHLFERKTSTHLAPDRQPFVIGFVGRVEEEKGVDVLLEAVSNLDISYELWIIGNGSFMNKLLLQAANLGVHDRLKVYKAISHAEIPSYLRRMDILVLPSRTTSSWKEQFGRVLIEAMAIGTNVIGSDSGAIPDVIENAGLIFREGDSLHLKAQILKLIKDPMLGKSLSQKGRERVSRNFSVEVIAERTFNLYKKIVSLSCMQSAKVNSGEVECH